MRLEAVLDMQVKKEEGDERRAEAQQRAQEKARSAAPNTEVDLA